MKKTIENQQLFIFLNEHDAWEKFENNLNNFHRERSSFLSWKAYQEKANKKDCDCWWSLQHAFLWEETPEGANYWFQLHSIAWNKKRMGGWI